MLLACGRAIVYLHVSLRYLHWHCDVSFTHVLRCVLASYRHHGSHTSQPPSSWHTSTYTRTQRHCYCRHSHCTDMVDSSPLRHIHNKERVKWYKIWHLTSGIFRKNISNIVERKILHSFRSFELSSKIITMWKKFFTFEGNAFFGIYGRIVNHLNTNFNSYNTYSRVSIIPQTTVN